MSVDLTSASGTRSGSTIAVARSATGDSGARRYRSRRRTVAVISGLILAATCVLMVFPFLWAGVSSVKPTDVAFANPPVFRFAPTFQPYIDLWQTTNFYLYLANTVVIAVVSTLVALLVGLPCAYALSRYGGVASLVLLVLALIFRALPRFAVVLPMYEISKSIGI